MTRFVILVVLAVLGAARAIAGPGMIVQPPPGQAVVSGSLAIRAVQGSSGGGPLSGNPVEINLLHNGQPFHQIKGTLNEMGLMVVDDVPVAMGVRPVVRIEHSGVTYQEAGPMMTAASPDASVEVTVFETTPTPPAWRVVSRQAIVTPGEGRLLVSESVFVDNPNDRTWLGSDEASNGKLTTVELLLPDRTENVTLHAGFHGWCCTTLEDRTLGVQMPLMPGRYNYRFAYEIPASDGAGTVSLGAPAETVELAVIVPESGITAQADGLTAGSVQMTEQGPLRLYTGREVAAGQTPSITLTGLPSAAPGPPSAPGLPASPSPSPGPGGSIWLVLAGVAVVGVVLVLVLRRGS
jgi:hypothetical protein